MKALSSALFLALIAFAVSGPVGAEEWQTYRNTRFGTRVEVPANFRTGDEPAYGKGQKFYAPDGSGVIHVYGEFNATGGNLAHYRRLMSCGFIDAEWHFETLTHGDNWYDMEVSGKDERLHIHVEHGKGCDSTLLHHIEFRFRTEDAARWRPVIEHGVRSLSAPCR